VAALRKAFTAALQDQELLAAAEKMRIDIDPVSGEELQSLIEKIYATPPALVARAKAALGQ
jgi:tripartite-type tricarboxylate transporter receptor subunit TctC